MKAIKVRTGPGRPSAEESQLKKRDLLEAALDEFAEAGFHSASLRAIAERAGISTRTLYNHYADKMALFEACLNLSSDMAQSPSSWEKGDLATRLYCYTMALHEHHWTERAIKIGRLVYRESTVLGDLREVIRQQFERFQIGPVAQILRQAGFRDEDCQRLASYFVGMALGEWQRRVLFGGAALTLEESRFYAREVTSVFLLGVMAQDRGWEI